MHGAVVSEKTTARGQDSDQRSSAGRRPSAFVVEGEQDVLGTANRRGDPKHDDESDPARHVHHNHHSFQCWELLGQSAVENAADNEGDNGEQRREPLAVGR